MLVDATYISPNHDTVDHCYKKGTTTSKEPRSESLRGQVVILTYQVEIRYLVGAKQYTIASFQAV